MEEISNSRRILAVSLTNSTQHLTRVIKDLTGSAPEPTSTSLAGSSHTLSIETAYYKADVPIWLDLIQTPSEWSASFLTEEAKEVLEVLGGVMVVFSIPSKSESDEGRAARDLIQQVGKVVKEGLGGWEWDGVGLCLGVGEHDDVDAWDDCCAEWGLEFVQVKSQSVPTRNEFGEKTGIPRALEALQANDWSHASLDDLGSEFGDLDAELAAAKASGKIDGAGTGKDHDDGDDDSDLDPENLDFGFDRDDFAGLKRAIWNAGQEGPEDFMNGEPGASGTHKKPAATTAGDDGNNDGDADQGDIGDEDIQKIERMMQKLQAVRDTSAGLPEEQRKRVAAKAVAEVMKEL
ncbi:alpha and gamma adaptin binding protein p34-domain-containing protein [Xylariomycetidae sp. FL2044]|nr:alpha and gamma adaptin binding protein p34-domain-containing protein [Xylariomycetidae sp. FL2044]